MTGDTKPMAEITADRLAQWGAELSALGCTPVLLLGLGHDAQGGKVAVVTVDDLGDDVLDDLLRLATLELRARRRPRG